MEPLIKHKFLLSLKKFFLVEAKLPTNLWSEVFTLKRILCNWPPGLYGDNGILPASVVLRPDGRPAEQRFQAGPSLLWLLPSLGLTAEDGLDLTCLLGCSLALVAIMSRRMRDSLVFALLWFLYLSVYVVSTQDIIFFKPIHKWPSYNFYKKRP